MTSPDYHDHFVKHGFRHVKTHKVGDETHHVYKGDSQGDNAVNMVEKTGFRPRSKSKMGTVHTHPLSNKHQIHLKENWDETTVTHVEKAAMSDTLSALMETTAVSFGPNPHRKAAKQLKVRISGIKAKIESARSNGRHHNQQAPNHSEGSKEHTYHTKMLDHYSRAIDHYKRAVRHAEKGDRASSLESETRGDEHVERANKRNDRFHGASYEETAANAKPKTFKRGTRVSWPAPSPGEPRWEGTIKSGPHAYTDEEKKEHKAKGWRRSSHYHKVRGITYKGTHYVDNNYIKAAKPAKSDFEEIAKAPNPQTQHAIDKMRFHSDQAKKHPKGSEKNVHHGKAVFHYGQAADQHSVGKHAEGYAEEKKAEHHAFHAQGLKLGPAHAEVSAKSKSLRMKGNETATGEDFSVKFQGKVTLENVRKQIQNIVDPKDLGPAEVGTVVKVTTLSQNKGVWSFVAKCNNRYFGDFRINGTIS